MTSAGCCGWAASGSGHRSLQARKMVAGSGQATAVPEQLAAVEAQRPGLHYPQTLLISTRHLPPGTSAWASSLMLYYGLSAVSKVLQHVP